MKMKFIAALFAITVSACAGSAQGVYYAPDQATIAALESAKFMPPGSRPITEYARYYVGLLRDGHRMIQARFLLRVTDREPPAGTYIVSGPGQFPDLMDGGCALINILYDPDTKRFETVRCNGYA
jgi:hypothetical protein